MYSTIILFLLWLFSQTLGFVLPAAGRVLNDGAPLRAAWERSQPVNRDYDSGSPSSWAYDVVSSAVTTKTLSGLVAKAEATLAYDPIPVLSTRTVGGFRAPPLGKAGFAAKTGGELMVHPFSGGGTHITTSTRLAAHAESATLGGPSGLFLAPTRQVDALLASGASRSQMEIALGLNEGALSGGTLMRIDVANPFARGLSLPTSGNMFFRPGTGLTWGGLNEGIITSPLKTDPGVLLRPIP